MNVSALIPIRRALISVSDKSGIVDFARALKRWNVEILSTGGTHKLLLEHGLACKDISEYTGFPEMMDGRVKTLHPKVHGGLLGRRGKDDALMAQHGIEAIDLVVVNLYPFEQTIAKPDCDFEDAIENIDIGGPTMLRSAAKNHRDVAVVVDSGRYAALLAEMEQHQGALSYETRFNLAVQAFEHTAGYDGAIANYLGKKVDGSVFPRTFNAQFIKAEVLRYGENPHQMAAFYVDKDRNKEASVASAQQIQGKSLSFNNVADTDAALETIKLFESPACVIVKHANPCGVALGNTLLDAYEKSYSTDPESAFGGIIAFNRPLDAPTATTLIERQFVEVIIAPSVTPEAQAVLAQKPNIRVLSCGDFPAQALPGLDFKRVTGGLLVQDKDIGAISAADLKIVSRRSPSPEEVNDLLFAWKVAKMVKSNAIVYAKGLRTIGVGAGQMSRVNSARIAAIKAEHAGLAVAGAVMASDAFFPFRDGIDNAAAVGIRAIIQPGGSIRDEEVIASANEHDIAMVFTQMRHFRH